MNKAIVKSILVLLVITATLSADEMWWGNPNQTPPGGDGNWFTADNWGPLRIPTKNDLVYINDGNGVIHAGSYPTISSGAAEANNISIGDWNHGVLNITGGILNIRNNFDTGNRGDGILNIADGNVTLGGMVKVGFKGPYGLSGNGDVNMTGGILNAKTSTSLPSMAIGLDSGGFGKFHLKGGTINTARVSVGAWGPGSMTVNGGTMNIDNVLGVSVNAYDANFVMTSGTITGPLHSNIPGVQQVWIGYDPYDSYANGTLDMYGGSITASWALEVGYSGYSTGIFNLYGGTFTLACDLKIDHSVAALPGSQSKINLAGGQLIILNTWRTMDTVYNQLVAYKNAGQLVAYNNAANTVLHIDKNSPAAGNITVWGENLSQETKASHPTPIDGATVYSPVTLQWLQGIGAVTQNVYVGTSQAAVAVATTASPEYKGSFPAAATSFVPTQTIGKALYWRIDTVKSGSIVIGSVWNVNLGSYFVLEDCESYTSSPSYWTSGGTSTVALATDTSNLGYKWGYQHGKAVKITYNNTTQPFGEAIYTLPAAYNSNLYNGAILRMDIHGDVNNVGPTEPVTVILKDAAGNSSKAVTYSMPGTNNGLIQEKWELWYSWTMSFGDFAQAGFDATSVKKIIVHVGGSSASGAHGLVYIDDIRVYPPMCTAQHQLYGDFNYDCNINMGDLFALTRDWLMGSVVISPSTPPTPIAWYKFNESSGAVAVDTIAGNNGTLRNGPTWVSGGGPDGTNCININGGRTNGTYGVSIPASVFNGITNTISFSMWVKGASSNPVSPTGNVFTASNTETDVWDANGNQATKMYFQCPFESGTVSFCAGMTPPGSFDNITWNTSYVSDWRGAWVHYACVKDGNAGTMSIYRNGVLVAALLNNATKPINDIKYFWIGATQLFGYAGMIDDFRIFDVALSQSQVVSLANKTSVTQPLLNWRSDANIDGKVDFVDFAAMAEGWLEGQQLWPHN